MITVTSVSKVYGKKQNAFSALQGVNFEIPDGKTAAIIGKSGSGKSTMMHILGGLDRPTDGEVVIGGQSLTQLKRRAMDRFRAQDLGFVFQSFFVEANQTCYQNVALPLEINEIPLRKRKALVAGALEQVELSGKTNQKAGNLSGGQKQRLAIARAIVNQPKLLLADEPTGNLDSATGEKVIELLFRLHRELGSALVIVTHDDELANRCDMKIVMKDGRVVEVTDNDPARRDTTHRDETALSSSQKSSPDTTSHHVHFNPPANDARPAKTATTKTVAAQHRPASAPLRPRDVYLKQSVHAPGLTDVTPPSDTMRTLHHLKGTKK